MHRNSLRLFDAYARTFFGSGVEVLEIGPDRIPSTYQRRAGPGPARWDTLDLASRQDLPLTHRTSDEYRFPLPDSTYDIVFSAQVIEHVPRVWRWMAEVARVCRPGGHVITINPISWQYHEAPVDCWRIYPEGMRALCDEAGLEVVLSHWGNMELRRLGRFTPERLRRHRLLQRLSGVIGLAHAALKFPLEGAFDTVTVARKPIGGNR